jgi:ABC-2 type transport system ATP-binding protein
MIRIRYEDHAELGGLPERCAVSREGQDYLIRYEPSKVPTAWLLSELQKAGSIRELTAQQQNIDHMIAAMYREMDL